MNRLTHISGRLTLVVGLLLFISVHTQAEILKFIYVSDSHYGLFRTFRGHDKVSAENVNKALLSVVNHLPADTLPADSGVAASTRIGSVDFIVHTGDIANRMQDGVQTATQSWKQFEKGWYGSLTLKTKDGKATPIYLLPGNHDTSNAIGYPKPMRPKTDATSLVEIFNRMTHPSTPRTVLTYHYQQDKVHYAFTQDGIHFVFLHIWPDSQERYWMEKDLKTLKKGTPVILFTHDPPTVEAKHFLNPHGKHDINTTDRFENLLCDTSSVPDRKDIPTKERKALADFLLRHPSVKAYFHGHTNYNEFYDWRTDDGKKILSIFRVDSPMKGELSSVDESRLSFQVVCIDTDQHLMTVRECLWNRHPLQWGESKTISIR